MNTTSSLSQKREMVHQEVHNPETCSGEKADGTSKINREPEAKRMKPAPSADNSHTTDVQKNYIMTNILITGDPKDKETSTQHQGNNGDVTQLCVTYDSGASMYGGPATSFRTGESPSTAERLSNDTNLEGPFTTEIHEFVHLFFDEFGNEIHHLSTTESFQRFTDARGQILANVDTPTAEKHGIVRRDFFHIHHSQVPSYMVRGGASREDIMRNSRDLYRNTVERIYHPGMQSSPFRAMHWGIPVPAYNYPDQRTSTNQYFNSTSSCTKNDPHLSVITPRQEEMARKSNLQGNELPNDDSKKVIIASAVNKESDLSTALTSVPPIQNPNMSSSVPGASSYPPTLGVASSYVYPSGPTSIPFDHNTSYSTGPHPMYSYGHSNTQTSFGGSSRRMGPSYPPYQQPTPYEYHPSHYPPYVQRSSQEDYTSHGESMIRNFVPDQKSPRGYEAPVYDVNENDVLCGRGGTTNQHVGNRKFRKMVHLHKESYLKCKKKDKPSIAMNIVKLVREANPPGRFLKHDKESGSWFDVGDARAAEKVSQALREGAPALRKSLDFEGTMIDDDSKSDVSNKKGLKTRPSDFDIRVENKTVAVKEDPKTKYEEVAI